MDYLDNLKTANDTIESLINLSADRHMPSGLAMSSIVKHLRDLLEACMKLLEPPDASCDTEQKRTQSSVHKCKTNPRNKPITKLYSFLQLSAHITLSEDTAARLFMKYYEYLLEARDFIVGTLNIPVLKNIKSLAPISKRDLEEFYLKIAEKIHSSPIAVSNKTWPLYYVVKRRPFFVNGERFYELALATDASGFQRAGHLIAFSKHRIDDRYAVRIQVQEATFDMAGKRMPLLIVTDWKIGIRDVEFKRLFKIATGEERVPPTNESNSFCQYIKDTGLSLLDIVELSDTEYLDAKNRILGHSQKPVFFIALDLFRKIISKNKCGSNLTRFLLEHTNNVLLKRIVASEPNEQLSGLYASPKAISFDRSPFSFNLPETQNMLSKVWDCIPIDEDNGDLLAATLKINTEKKDSLFTPIAGLSSFSDIDRQIENYNSRLWPGHRPGAEIRKFCGHLYIHSYVDDTVNVLKTLEALSQERLGGAGYMEDWARKKGIRIDDPKKEKFLFHDLSESRLHLIYGPAGTGKSYLMNHIADAFPENNKLFLAQTNPAVSNLRRRISSAHSRFCTVDSFLKSQNNLNDYTIVFVDEASTIPNKSTRDLLSKGAPKLLIIAGDTYQIPSIKFGNWFDSARHFLPQRCVHNLDVPFRTKEKTLLRLWEAVREMNESVQEILDINGFSKPLGEDIFIRHKDEIILCANYDGFYGITNVNLFMQANNPNPPVKWKLVDYKVNDPILFNEKASFGQSIHNNTKGIIRSVQLRTGSDGKKCVSFVIEVEEKLSPFVPLSGAVLLPSNQSKGSLISFSVYETSSDEEDEDFHEPPFQIAYAVSIHKAQGLEYDSVKLIITDESDESITHNVFYTAITRAKQRLEIYWSKEVEKRVLSALTPRNTKKDSDLLKHFIERND